LIPERSQLEHLKCQYKMEPRAIVHGLLYLEQIVHLLVEIGCDIGPGITEPLKAARKRIIVGDVIDPLESVHPSDRSPRYVA
jgi:hypothetical protein